MNANATKTAEWYEEQAREWMKMRKLRDSNPKKMVSSGECMAKYYKCLELARKLRGENP